MTTSLPPELERAVDRVIDDARAVFRSLDVAKAIANGPDFWPLYDVKRQWGDRQTVFEAKRTLRCGNADSGGVFLMHPIEPGERFTRRTIVVDASYAQALQSGWQTAGQPFPHNDRSYVSLLVPICAQCDPFPSAEHAIKPKGSLR